MKNRSKTVICLLLSVVLLFAQMLPAANTLLAFADETPGLMRGVFRYAGMYKAPGDSVLDYAYSDEYFSEDAAIYNPSLSTMSLCFEMSSWSSLDQENWADKTINARNLLTDIGFVDFAQNDFWNDSPTVESIGAVMARKELEDSTLIALAVRGGGYFSEWGSNVLVGSDDEHTGFATARDNVVSFLNDYIADHGITGRVKVWLVGFSRGAAVANMTAGYLNEHGLAGDAVLSPSDLYCYTFEAPQGIQELSAGPDADYGNIHNIINPNDIVPLVAPNDWGFGRYNETAHLLPTITSVHYPTAYEQMMVQYAKILEGVELLEPEQAEYSISEYAKTLQINVNCLSFLSDGAPFIEVTAVDNTHLPQSVMLAQSVSALVNAAQSREHFHDAIESDLSALLSDLLGVGQGATLSAYIQELGETLTANEYENLIYVLEPMLQLNLTSFDERTAQVAERLYEIIPQPEGYTDILGTAASLTGLMANWLTTNPQSLLNLALSLSSTNMIQAHYAEITMAWLRIEDPNYNSAPFAHDIPESMRIVRINCPVDLRLYDESGALVASIIGGAVDSAVPGIGCAVNPDGEMVLYLPADASYSIGVTATGSGTVNCSVGEFNVVRGGHTYVVDYPDVPIQQNDELTLVLPELPDSEFTDEPAQGSTVIYLLLDSIGTPIEPGSILRGKDVRSFTVRAERNNEFGQVLGGGVYTVSSFARLEAVPVSGSTFLGWYDGDQLISSDAVFRFPVSEDLTLTAHFGEVALHPVEFASSENGSILNANLSYPAGSQVLLTAQPDEGYALAGWNTTAGELHTDETGSVFLIVPENGATVSASFKKIGPVCPTCGAILSEGASHQALCGNEAHFICADDYQAEEHRICTICRAGHLCEGGHGYEAGQCGSYECGGCGRDLPIYRNHKSDCDHYYCTAGFVEEEHALCETCGNFCCSGGTHRLPCGHYACADGYNAADHVLCSECSAYLCNGSEHLTVCGHYACANGFAAAEHALCSECSAYLCNGSEHLAACGHHACADGFDKALHAACPHCSSFLCDGKEHTLCTICTEGYLCQGGHGTGSGECGRYLCEGCGEELLISETHRAECGHYACSTGYQAEEHTVCEHCSGFLCNGESHGKCNICRRGYVCEGGHGMNSGECGLYICKHCWEELPITMTHLSPCGHYRCDPGFDESEHGICGLCENGYACQEDHECLEPAPSSPPSTDPSYAPSYEPTYSVTPEETIAPETT